MRTLQRLSLVRALIAVLSLLSVALISVSGQATAQSNTPPWSYTDRVSSQNNATPKYTVSIHQPVANTDANFNAAVQKIIDAAVAEFKKTAANPAPNTGTESSLNISYDLFITRSGIVSVRFSLDQYIAGAAHPGHASAPLNYNPTTGKTLQLADLFKKNSNYLAFIAKYCTDQLKREGRLNFPEGSQAKPENYQTWNLDRSGLLITFDPYLVGPWAQGESVVFIPYTTLADLLQAEFWQLW